MYARLKVVSDPALPPVDEEAQARRYAIAFDAVAPGIAFFDRDSRLISANRGFAALHRLAPEALRPGASLREVAEALDAANACPMAVDDYVAYCAAILTRRESRIWRATLPDGRALRVRHEPTPDGGWIAIHADVSEEREARRLREACATLQALIDRVPGHLWVKDGEGRFLVGNRALASDFGRNEAADLVGFTDFDLRPPEVAKALRRLELGVALTGEPIVGREAEMIAASGERKSFRSTTTALRAARGEIARLVGVEIETKAAAPAEAEIEEVDALDMAAAGAPTSALLGALLRVIERKSPGVVAAVLRLDADGQGLSHAAPSTLPDALAEAAERLSLGAHAPAFAEALQRRAPMVSLDLAQDRQWGCLGGLAASYGFRASWATPILGRNDEPLGVFATFSRQAREPDEAEARRARFASRLAAIAIDRERSAADLDRVKRLL